MRTPKKITPDRIRAAIVQVFFSTQIPFEPLVGFVYQALSAEGFSYENRHPQQGVHPFYAESTGRIAFELQHYFFNESISIRLDEPGALTFNCLGNYIGWSSYFAAIQKVLEAVFKVGIIQSFFRVGIRYTSVFENMDVQDALTLSFSMGEPQQRTYHFAQFRTAWEDGGYQVIALLGTERVPTEINKETDTVLEKRSVIDIDVIRQGFEETDLSSMFSLIEKTHKREKEIFFGLMKPEFLESLHPEYE